MWLLDAAGAVYYLYSIIFTGCLLVTFWGIRMLYRAIQKKDELLFRKAKLILVMSVIGMVSVVIVSLALIKKMPF